MSEETSVPHHRIRTRQLDDEESDELVEYLAALRGTSWTDEMREAGRENLRMYGGAFVLLPIDQKDAAMFVKLKWG